jgi:hypothetical protein
MNIRLTPVSLCLLTCLATVSVQSHAGLFGRVKNQGSQTQDTSTVVPPPAPSVQPHAQTPQVPPSLPSANYPNGRGWRAIENDFIATMAKIDLVDGKVDAVKADTVLILTELDDVDADHYIIKSDLVTIKSDLGIVKNDVSDIKADIASIESGVTDITNDVAAIANDVDMLKNTLQLQATVDLAGADSINDQPVTVYVQVSQNGVGVTGLLPDAFMFSSSFPFGIATYCGTPACFSEGVDGLYALQLDGSWDAITYAGTLQVAQTVSTPAGNALAQGTSLVTFRIP